jgi:hypothetical protein
MATIEAEGVALDVLAIGTGEIRGEGVALDVLVMELELDIPIPPLQGQGVRRKTHLQGRQPGLRRGPGPLI